MATLTKSEIAALPVDERLTPIDDLWESLENGSELLPTRAWHRPLLEARLTANEANPQPTHSWESINAEMEEKWLT